MRYISLFFLLFLGSVLHAQYYYNDIIAAKQSAQNYLIIKAQKIKTIEVRSYDDHGEQVTSFSLQQVFSNNWNKMELSTQNATGEKSLLTTYYKNNLVSNTIERSKHIETITNYSYDAQNRIISIESISKDSAYKYQNTEKHIWHYGSNNAPEEMIKIRNGKDTTLVKFTYDEQGNVAEEKWFRMGRLIETYYYYYDDNHLITDIVRYNRNAKKLLPDFMFEYNAQKQLSSMTQVSANSNGYLIWHYIYNAAGLKTEEICKDKQNQLIANFKYFYQQ
ncbi:hypothetical protein [Hydrotalea sandarakina]|jgi:hypothetical protein|uniref:YD repeat-containing protein n=1 Tax=Hydrotalea sandarakina TaxID=1004304 RepID=A0A2W7RYZ6_9BACT|nr:hypothetical protein [Hydrotalea sandarakina]PZX66038.1 hypothetical protein LX80_00536 [Hydrotalea sandarakina]